MSPVGRTIEYMFDLALDPRAEKVRALQERIDGMQRTRMERTLPTSASLAGLLPDRGLAVGAGYVVEGSTALALELLSEPSRAGVWCAVVGMPDLGIEAAASVGVALERLVLVPHPGEQWFAVVSALVDAVGVVLVRPPGRVGEAMAGRLASRLRQREAVLLSVAEWPRPRARIAVTRSDWVGIESGAGHLVSRRVTVAVSAGERSRSRTLALPTGALPLHAVR